MFYYSYRGVCVVVRPQPSKLETRVRFPHAAPISQFQAPWTEVQVTVSKRLTFWNGSLFCHGVGKVSGILLQKK